MLASFDTHIFWDALSSSPYWRGALLAIELTVASLAVACVIGFLLALGMSRPRILRRVIVPQAIRIIIPPTGNEFITLLKLTSLASVISLHELLTAAGDLQSATFRYLEAYTAALVYYLAIVSVLMWFQAQLERRFTWSSAARRRRGVAPAVPVVSHDAR